MASIIKADTLQSTTSNIFVLNSAGTEYARFDSTGLQLSGNTLSVGGTSLPGNSIVTLTGTQTLTNKTLTSPTLTTPNINSAQFATVSGTAPLYACRAWVNFIGTGTVTINASGNVSSITDNGLGDYTVNFTTAISDANFTSVLSQGTTPADVIITNTGQTTSTVRITTYRPATGLAIDMAIVCAAIFR